MEFIKRFSSFVLVICLIFSSCTTDETEELNTSPELPPVSTLVMDFSNFEEGGNTGGRTMAMDNWGHAALGVGFWNLIISLNMAIPVASFKVAISQKATFDKDRQLWVWSYDYDHVGKKYSSELTAKITNTTVDWEMRISEENGFQNVLWFKGTTALDRTNGFWILSKDANNPVEFLRVDWEREGDKIGSIKYTDISGGNGNGSFINYGRNTDASYNLFYTIFSTVADNTAEVEWNETDGNGRVKNPAHFMDENWHCWNIDFEDIDC